MSSCDFTESKNNSDEGWAVKEAERYSSLNRFTEK
jgi:hypothetical protein